MENEQSCLMQNCIKIIFLYSLDLSYYDSHVFYDRYEYAEQKLHTLRKTSTLLKHMCSNETHTSTHAPSLALGAIASLCHSSVFRAVQRETRGTDAISVSVCVFEVQLHVGEFTLRISVCPSFCRSFFCLPLCLCDTLFTCHLFYLSICLTGAGLSQPSMTASSSSSSGLEVLLSALQV